MEVMIRASPQNQTVDFARADYFDLVSFEGGALGCWNAYSLWSVGLACTCAEIKA